MTHTPHPVKDHLTELLIKERRSDRRWKTIRSFVWATLVLIYALLIFKPVLTQSGDHADAKQPYVALLSLNGEIMPDQMFSAQKVIPELNRAFRDKHARGVLLVINSPGGSPVQASIIHDKIEQLKKRYKKKVVVVAQDTLASGAYLVATAADEIYVQKDTLTGSVGVIMTGFGFSDAIEKLGIARRVFTAGQNKDRLDPFKPLNPNDVTKVKALLNEVHQHFIDAVIAGRGDRLKGDRSELFSGDFWTGSTAATLGMVDGVANTWEAMQKEFNVTHYKDYSPKPSFIKTLLGKVEAELPVSVTAASAPQLAESLG